MHKEQELDGFQLLHLFVHIFRKAEFPIDVDTTIHVL